MTWKMADQRKVFTLVGKKKTVRPSKIPRQIKKN